MRRPTLKLKKYRIKAKLTQLQVARELGLAGQHIVSDWERGVRKPHDANIKKLATILNIEYESLKREFDLFHHYKTLDQILYRKAS